MEGPAAVAETHVSVTFFVGDRAYKMKKPVRTGFLDFTDRAARLAVCRREVELNRRLAPDVYLGVGALADPDGDEEPLVVMRRMPASRRLSRLVTADPAAAARCVDEVAALMAAFHERAARSAEISAAADPAALESRWVANGDEIKALTPSPIDREAVERAVELARRWLGGRQPLLAARDADGRVVDGHGDLLADDIFLLDDGPRVLDCLEFDDMLRYGDVVADIAFLAMDLERLDAPHLARRLLTAYATATGDRPPASLVDHHIAYRAQVRAKVAALRHSQGVAEAADAARALHDLCLRHLDQARIRLVLVGGLPGTGKTTLARALAAERGWTLLRSDEVRKELAGLPPTARTAAAWQKGLYDPAVTDRTYGELLDRAARLLGMGESVILDASWSTWTVRRAAAGVADDAAADLVPLQCAAPDDVSRARIDQRRRAGTDASDATAEVAVAMAAAFDPWPEAATVSTGGDVEAALADARHAVDHP